MTDLATLRQAVAHPDHEVRYAALRQLAAGGGVDPRDATPVLVGLLYELEEPHPCSLAAWELGKLGPAARPAARDLATIAKRPARNSDPRFASLWALARIGPGARDALETIDELARGDEDPNIRLMAVRTLGAIGGREVAATVIAAMRDEDCLVREEAARALGAVGVDGDSEVVTVLEAGARDAHPLVARAAAETLARVAPSARVPPEPDVSTTPGADALVVLLDRLESTDRRTRGETTWAIGTIGPAATAAVPHLIRHLQEDDDFDARWGSTWALGRIGSRDAVAALGAALQADPDPDVRAQAAHALGQIGARASTDALVAALNDWASLVREEAARALGRLGPVTAEVAAALESRQGDPHPVVRSTAAEALAAASV